MRAKKSNVVVSGESSLNTRQKGDRSTEKFKSKSTSTHDDGSTTTTKEKQKSTTNKKGKNRVRSRSVVSIRDSEGRLLAKQVDRGGSKTRTRVTRRGSQAGY